MQRIFLAILFAFSLSVQAGDISGSISGKILNRLTKEPVAGAKVEIYGQAVISDRQGNFTVQNLPKGNLIIEIDAIGFERYIDTFSVISGESVEQIFLNPAENGIVIMGMVRDKVRQRPVSNATVSLDNQIVKTDSAGKYRISGVSPGKKIMDVLCPGFLTYTEEVFVDENHRVLNVMILPNAPFAVVYGKVLNTMTGAAVRGALVEIGNYKGVTGLDGNFIIKGIEPGQHPLKVKAYNYKTSNDTIQIAAVKKEYIFKLMPEEKYGVVEGVIKSAEKGEAISGAEVVIGGNRGVSGTDGSFIVKDVTIGAQSVCASHPDYFDFEEQLVVTEGKQDFVIVMRGETRYGKITGVIKDKTEKLPISGVAVSCGGRSGHTDEFGKFTLDGVVCGQKELLINGHGYEVSKTMIDIVEGTQIFNIFLSKLTMAGIMTKQEFTENELNWKKTEKNSPAFSDIVIKKESVSEKTGSLEGIIIDDLSGKPVVGATVMIEDKITTTDETGKYQIKFLPYRRYSVTVITDKNGIFMNETVVNSSRSIFNIKLCTKERRGTLYGVIYDESNELPVAGARLSLSGKTITSDEDGKFQFPDNPEDFYSFSADASGYARYENVIKIKEGNLRLDVYLKRIQ